MPSIMGATLALDLAALTRGQETPAIDPLERLRHALRSWMEGFVPPNLVPVATAALVLIFAFPVALWLWPGAQTGEIGRTEIAARDEVSDDSDPSESKPLDEASEQIVRVFDREVLQVSASDRAPMQPAVGHDHARTGFARCAAANCRDRDERTGSTRRTQFTQGLYPSQLGVAHGILEYYLL